LTPTRRSPGLGQVKLRKRTRTLLAPKIVKILRLKMKLLPLAGEIRKTIKKIKRIMMGMAPKMGVGPLLSSKILRA